MKKRIISAVILILIALPFVILGGLPYAFLIGVLSILGLKEIIDLKKSHNDYPIVIILISITIYLLLVYTDFNGNNLAYGSTYMHLIALPLCLLIPTLFYKKQKYQTSDAFYLIGAILFLAVAFNSFILVREMGLKVFIYLISIPIITDTFAMLFGRKIGKHKLCPDISPKKTWEGTIAGTILGTTIPVILWKVLLTKLSFSILIKTCILSIIGQLGDLIFSKIKRENQLKDFSNIIPGHGGILDRFDSTIAIFMMYIFLLYLGL